MSKALAVIDGSAPPVNDNGHGFGPVGKAGALGSAIATTVATGLMLILPLFDVEIDPALVAVITGLMTTALTLVFTFYTPSKKVIEVVEVLTGKDVDGETIVRVDETPTPRVEPDHSRNAIG